MKISAFIIAIFLLLPFSIVAQSVSDLDIKNGFRHLKLGTSLSLVKNKRKVVVTFYSNPNIITYSYTGSDIEYVANVKVAYIHLDFFKDKLVKIRVGFNNFTEQEYNKILEALESVYGNIWSPTTNNNSKLLNSACWKGKKTELSLGRRYFFTQDDGTDVIAGALFVEVRDFDKQLDADDF